MKGHPAWNKGKFGVFKHSEETKKKMSLVHKGQNTWSKGRPLSMEHRRKLSEIGKEKRGDKNQNWKGDSVGYFALHRWVCKNFKAPRMCEFCKTIESYGYQWANLDGKYTRERKTWALLCISCHRNHDNKRGKQVVFNTITGERL